MNICITGGTGSLGTALVEAFLPDSTVERIVVLSRDEVKQHAMRQRFEHRKLNLFLGDVRDEERCVLAFWGCDTVIHTAALKQVPRGASDSLEFIKTNIQGTIAVVLAAIATGVSRVLVISSDKAVEATNLYGKTKAVAEDFAVNSNSYGYPRGTRISVLRYGNVLGSRGSVLEVWQEQHAAARPLTLTSGHMTRFLITLSQAVKLVNICLREMAGGEIFVPVLPCCRIEHLLRVLYPDDVIQRTGIRPGGEKLHEVLLSQEEVSRTQIVEPDRLYRIIPSFHSWRGPWSGPSLPRETLPLTSAGPLMAEWEIHKWINAHTALLAS